MVKEGDRANVFEIFPEDWS